LEERYPILLDFILANTQIDTTDAKEKAEKLAKDLRALLKSNPTQADLTSASSNANELASKVADIYEVLEKDTETLSILRVQSKGYFSRDFDRLFYATGTFAKRFEAEVEERGGWKGLSRRMGRAVQYPRSLLEGTMAGIESFGRGGMPEQLAATGLLAVAGPFTPLAIAGVALFKGVKAAMSMRQQRRDMAMVAPGLAYKEMADPAGVDRVYRRYAGQYTGQDEAQDLYGERAGRPQTTTQAPGGKPMTQAMMTGAIISGLSMFFSVQAFKVKWTKRVLEALERGHGIEGRQGGAGAALITALAPVITALAAVVAVLGVAWLAWQAGREIDKKWGQPLERWNTQRFIQFDRLRNRKAAAQSTLGINIHNRATELQKENPGMTRQEALNISTQEISPQESKVKRSLGWGAKAVGAFMAVTPGAPAVKLALDAIGRARTERAANIAEETAIQDKSFYQQMVAGLTVDLKEIFAGERKTRLQTAPVMDIKSDLDDPLLRNFIRDLED